MLGDGHERAQLGKVIALHHVDTIDYPRSMRRRRDMSAVLDVFDCHAGTVLNVAGLSEKVGMISCAKRRRLSREPPQLMIT